MLNILQANVAGAAPLARSADVRVRDLAQLVDARAVDVVTVQAGLDADATPAPLDALAAALPEHRFVLRHAGLAVLSRVPAELVEVVPLTRLNLPDDPNDRHLLVVRLPDHALTIAVGHFSWVDGQARRNVAEAIASLAGHGDAILAGDFNQQPDSAALADLAAAGFVDSWARSHPSDPGLTYEIGKPWGRLDYLLERTTRPLVAEIEVLLTDPAEAVSDHAVLLARLSA